MPRGAGTRQCRVSVLSFCICLTRIIDQLLELCGVIIGVFFSSSTWTPLVQSSVSLFSFAHESARLSLCFPIRCCTSSHVASRGGEPELENIAASFFPHGFIFCCVPLFSLCLSCFLQWRVWGRELWSLHRPSTAFVPLSLEASVWRPSFSCVVVEPLVHG